MRLFLLALTLFLFAGVYPYVAQAESFRDIDAKGYTVFANQLNLSETTEPAAVTGQGHVYTKTDNILYFQDGAGTEHGVMVDSGIVADNITAGSGTGLTVVTAGDARPSQVYVVTVDYTGLSAAATTAKHTIATLPAGMKLVSVIADTTTKYIGGAVSAATIQVGIDSGNTDAFLVAHDVFSAAVVQGDATAEPGVELIAATATQGGYIDWASTTVISSLITTTTANADALTQGSTTYYLETVQIK